MLVQAHLARDIHNPVTGDRIRFLTSPLAGEGETLSFRCWLPGGAIGAPLHSHAAMTETFIVEAGVLEIDLGGGDVRQLRPGERIVLAPGTDHGFRNPSAGETRFLNISSPGIELEKFLRAIYGLAAEGAAKADGMPADPLALAVALADTDMTMAGVPPRLQRGLVRGLARLAQWTGAARRVRAIWAAPVAGAGQC